MSPVIDADAHTVEYLPALAEYLRAEGVPIDLTRAQRDLSAVMPGALRAAADGQASETDRDGRYWRLARQPWWGFPWAHAADLATVALPRLLFERIPEFGIDFAVVYPSLGVGALHIDDEDMRRGSCRAVNRYHADEFAGLSERLIPVAVIPMHSPQEAVEELEHAVQVLGFRAVVMASYVKRPVPAVAASSPDAARRAIWLDSFGLDSDYDYDPLWRRCEELGVSVATHSGSIGWGSRQSVSNFVYNHIGHLATAGEAACKSLFLGGVPHRFPGLRFAFLEGGVGWACNLLADLVGHWDKRNLASLKRHNDPDNLDQDTFNSLVARYGSVACRSARPSFGVGWAVDRFEEMEVPDEWAATGASSVADIVRQFTESFYFGCEADDPMTACAFDRSLLPGGAKLGAMFGSDIGHWDVKDPRRVVSEAREMVERGLLSEASFSLFTFGHAASFFTATNPGFFDGTTVERHVRAATPG